MSVDAVHEDPDRPAPPTAEDHAVQVRAELEGLTLEALRARADELNLEDAAELEHAELVDAMTPAPLPPEAFDAGTAAASTEAERVQAVAALVAVENAAAREAVDALRETDAVTINADGAIEAVVDVPEDDVSMIEVVHSTDEPTEPAWGDVEAAVNGDDSSEQ